MTRHHRHVLEMALAAFVADWTVVGVVLHQALNNCRSEARGVRIGDGDARAVSDWRHAGHDEFACRVLFVSELLYSTLAACTYRA